MGAGCGEERVPEGWWGGIDVERYEDEGGVDHVGIVPGVIDGCAIDGRRSYMDCVADVHVAVSTF